MLVSTGWLTARLRSADLVVVDLRWRGERLVCGVDEVVEAGGRETAIVLDSRPPEQFRGEAVWFETGPVLAGPDGIARTPRGELRAGRVPWARNVPASTLYRPDHT